jgi:hypothetical protein
MLGEHRPRCDDRVLAHCYTADEASVSAVSSAEELVLKSCRMSSCKVLLNSVEVQRIHSTPLCACFSATERFIIRTNRLSTSVTIANIQKQSK